MLYICLCGFPPFSDELYSPENPYTLSQQIKMGRFDYPSPYWDSVGDPALDLIDRMLTVDVDKRITVDECLRHPWTTSRDLSLEDSTDGLTGAMGGLDFSKRKVQRQRTLLSALNDVRVTKVIPPSQDGANQVTVYAKNPGSQPQRPLKHFGNGVVAGDVASENAMKKPAKPAKKGPEASPAAKRAPEEFMAMGGRGDEALFGDEASRYVPEAKLEEINGAS